jgi:hypothetical protein
MICFSFFFFILINIIRYCACVDAGAHLRTEDPSGLKEALAQLQEKASLSMKNNLYCLFLLILLNFSIDLFISFSVQSKSNNISESRQRNNSNENDQRDENVEEFDPNGDQKKRIEFMIETILDLKNNKMKLVLDKDANQNVNRIKKIVKNYLKEKEKDVDNRIKISWADLISEENKGRSYFNFLFSSFLFLLISICFKEICWCLFSSHVFFFFFFDVKGDGG